MADSLHAAGLASTLAAAADAPRPRHTALVRLTHWITALCFILLLITGVEIVISHPRFYWGEAGNVLTPALFSLPIPASRASVPTGYGYVMPDQNGWSRYLHFQSAWLLVLAGLLYGIYGLVSGHFRKNLVPAKSDLSWRRISAVLASHLRLKRPGAGEASSYNVLQRLSYLFVVFVAFPLIIWTGLAMSPGFVSVIPATAAILGGQQSARTIHFFLTIFLSLFLLVHIAMIVLAGFGSRMRAMITGRVDTKAPEQEIP
ncbi:MAG TPA: cytochrome b/b6 domain-containing protein [Bryobacteraceae bacterium]|jgi:thiosulfate reductase cytochrome b subunit